MAFRKAPLGTFLALCILGTSVQLVRANNLSKVKHVIVVVQENRTPDNLFNQDANLRANGGIVQPNAQNQALACKEGGSAITLTGTSLFTCWDTKHSHSPDWINMWNHGAMNGACDIVVKWHNDSPPWCPDYVPNCVTNGFRGTSTCSYTDVDNTNGVLDPYFYIADHFGWANDMFQTNQGPSLPAHQFIFSGTSAPLGYSSPNPPLCPDGDNNSWECYKWFDAENVSLVGDASCIGDSGQAARDVAPKPGSNNDEALAYTPPFPLNTPGFPCYEHATLTDLLNGAGISWRYYARHEGELWTAPAAIQHICQTSGYGGHCQGPDFIGGRTLPPRVELESYDPHDNSGDGAPILTEIDNCTLPSVSWVIPDGNWSDHSGGPVATKGDGGPSWVSAIINRVALATSCDSSVGGYWYDTVILVTWDDWGGYYDHVVPPNCGPLQPCGYPGGTGFQYVYGFRVPLLVVGAYVKQSAQPPASYTGYISNVNHDFGSILNFIEYALAPSGTRLGGQFGIGGQNYPFADFYAPDYDPVHWSTTYSLSDFFDFNQTALPPPSIPQGFYPPSCFHKPKPGGNQCFSTSSYPVDPDSDADETD